MDKHENNRDDTCDPVNVKRHPADHFKHHTRTPGIADQTQDKENKMPPFKTTGYTVSPDPDGIKY
jgi:hypothetical protein